jgi:alpha-tubulin suppressor-like RCC1 family protein
VGVQRSRRTWRRNDDQSPISEIQVPSPSLTSVVSVAAGAYHSLALKSDGTVWAWGYNPYGNLGDNTVTTRLVPVQVLPLSGVIAISASTYQSFALKSDG